MRELREAWCDWMSGRQRGNFYKMLGSSNSGDGGRAGRVGRDNTSNSKFTVNCFICGEAGHRAVDCKANRSISPNVDRVFFSSFPLVSTFTGDNPPPKGSFFTVIPTFFKGQSGLLCPSL